MLSNTSNKIANFVIKWASYIFKKSLIWILPIVSVLLVFGFIVLISIVCYIGLRYWLLPKAIIREPIYFNFANNEPTARFNILSDNKQWSYIKDTKDTSIPVKSSQQTFSSSNTNTDSKVEEDHASAHSSSSPLKSELSYQQPLTNTKLKRFLVPGVSYIFDISLVISKSARNMDIGKFMVFVRLFDSTGDAIAKSFRPAYVPYQSATTIFLENIFHFPFILLGLREIMGISFSSIRTNMQLINNYVEPMSILPPTELVELSLSTSSVDVTEAYLTIMPTLTGFRYYMHYYPWISFFAGVSIISAIFISFTSFTVLVVYIISRLSGWWQAQLPAEGVFDEYDRIGNRGYSALTTSNMNNYGTTSNLTAINSRGEVVRSVDTGTELDYASGGVREVLRPNYASEGDFGVVVGLRQRTTFASQ